tara:strand:+ start:82 stop:447 length:366 start_codon:yes stop_codon:yes gene_type:complete
MTTDGKQYSYDLTARLSYFVISIELIFCGYVLLHAKEFIQIQHLSKLFLIAGLSVLFGLLWRFAYNQTYHESQHNKRSAKWLTVIMHVGIHHSHRNILHYIALFRIQLSVLLKGNSIIKIL